MPRLRSTLGGLTVLLALGLLLSADPLFFPEPVHAQGATDLTTNMFGYYAWIIGKVIVVLNFVAWWLFMLLDIVMDPQLIFDLNDVGQDGSLMNMLRDIWQLCRDLVNVFMALLLIYEAGVMIVKADATKVKEMLPKFVIALVAVNFSWFIPRAIFDVSQVLTYTVYQIPSMIGQEGCTMPPSNGQPARPCEIATEFRFFEQTTNAIRGAGGEFTIAGTAGWRCPIETIVCIRFEPDTGAGERPSRTRIINGLIVNHARLLNLLSITSPVPAGGGPVSSTITETSVQSLSFIIRTIIQLVIHIAIVFPLLAMVTAFFLRIPILWITIALMPLVAVGFVAGDKLGDFNPMKIIWEQFLSAVFLPVKVAVPFALSFVLLNAGAGATPPESLTQLTTPVALLSGVNNVWQMLWMIIALGILWKYSFAVLKKDEIMGMFAGKFEEMGKSLGGVAAKIPQALPIIPAPGGGFTSITRSRRALDLREISSELSSGRGLREIAGNRAAILAGNVPVDEQNRTKAATEILVKNSTVVNASITAGSLTALTPASTQEQRMDAIRRAVANLRVSPVSSNLSGMNNREVINALIAADSRLTDIAPLLREALEADVKFATDRTATAPGATPAPTPPTPTP